MEEKFNVGQVLGDSFKIFQDQWQLIYKIFGVIFLVSLGLQIPNIAAQVTDSLALAGLTLVFGIVGWLVNLLMNAGRIKIFAQMTRGEDVEVNQLFAYKHVLARLVGASFLLGLVYLLILGVFGVIAAVLFFSLYQTNVAAFASGLILLGLIWLVTFIYISIRLQYLNFVIVDQNTSIGEGFSQAFAITKGQVGPLVVLGIAVVLLNIAGLLMFGLGLLITIPVTIISQAYVYNVLANKEPKEVDYSQPTSQLAPQPNIPTPQHAPGTVLDEPPQPVPPMPPQT